MQPAKTGTPANAPNPSDYVSLISSDSDLRATIVQRLASVLTDRILAGAYAAGTSLRETELVAQYKVSRHVIREVLRTLSTDGLVEYTSFKGARIPVLTEANARDIYRARRLVECSSEAMTAFPAVESITHIHHQFIDAAQSESWARAFELDTAFHVAIVEASGGKLITEWHRSLLRALRLAHLVAPEFNREAWAISVKQHAIVVDAIVAGDAPKAREAMRQHLEDSEAILIAEMGSQT